MTGSTRNAYGSLQRLTEDTTKNLSDLRALVAAAVPTLVMDNLHVGFEQLLEDFRDDVNDLRADLDLLTDPGSEQ